MSLGIPGDAVLIDSSGWVQLLRKKGDPQTRRRVLAVFQEGRAVWCDIVRVELWGGVGSEQDEADLLDLEANVPSLELGESVWAESRKLKRLCRKKGKPVPTTDVIIFACAAAHGVELLHRDAHFDALASLVR